LKQIKETNNQKMKKAAAHMKKAEEKLRLA
jgi:hypothetical protein